ncbi:MAG: hypothetical protein ACXWRE_14970, partial [Pseudobdellovibrionaceae bacterium]
MKSKFFAFMLIGSWALLLANCSKSNTTPANSMVGPGMCMAGQVYTTQGCLPSSPTCGPNYGYLNGSCFPVTTAGINSMCGTMGYNNMGYNNMGYNTGYNTGYPTNCSPSNYSTYPTSTQYGYQGSCSSTDVVNT